MKQTEPITVTCIEYKTDGNTTKTVRRALHPLVDNEGHAFDKLAFRHIPDPANPHFDYIDIYKIENGYAMKITGLDLNIMDDILDKEYIWNRPELGTLRERLQKTNDMDIFDACIHGIQRATNAMITLYSLCGMQERSEKLRAMREQRLRLQEEERRRILEEKKAAEEAEKAQERARTDELTEDAIRKLKAARNDETITSEQLLLLADKFGISIHPKTVHNLKYNVTTIKADGRSLSARKDRKTKRLPRCEGVFDIFREVRRELSKQNETEHP